MDETSLRGELERALADEPPLGTIVGRSLRAGRKLRRRRRAGLAALCAAAVAVVIAVPTVLSGAGKPAPAAVAARPGVARTAYVAVGADTVVPVNTTTDAVGPPIKGLPAGLLLRGFPTSAASSPDRQTVYEVGTTTDGNGVVVPIDTATKRAGRPITLSAPCVPGSSVRLSSCFVYPADIAIDPNGKTGYVSYNGGVFPINLARKTAGKPISIPCDCRAMAFTPDGNTLYVLKSVPGSGVGQTAYATPTLTPIRTETNKALAPIRLPIKNLASGVAITPDGKTAYVVAGMGGNPYDNSVIPVDLATNRALAPIRLKARGQAARLVISPGGGTAYVVSARAVTPINTATNKAGPPINLPDRDGLAQDIVLTASGKTIYALTPRGIVPIRAASRTVLPIISIPDIFEAGLTLFAITPDGRTVYILTDAGVLPISTATNTAGPLIKLAAAGSITFAR